MRSLLRNALWLGLAAACGAAGLWSGFDWGARTTHSLHFQGRVSDDFAQARRALVELARHDNGSRAYAESELRMALYDIEQVTGGKPWWACYPRYRQTLAAAGLYLDRHASAADARFDVRGALRVCPAPDGAPAPPISDGNYRFELRDPEFPQESPIALRANVDAAHVVFETDEASSRFPKGARFEGALTWRAAERKWVLVGSPADAQATESGGCSDGPEVVDLERLILWVC